MKDFYKLETTDQLRALADPLRQRILENLCGVPRTTKQVAAILEEKPNKLYHHVETLEQAGLIKLVEKRQKRGTVEKYYQAVATQFAVDHRLIAPGVKASGGESVEFQTLLVNMLEASLAEARTSLDPGLFKDEATCLQTILAHSRISASREQLEQLGEALQNWLKALPEAQQPNAEVEYSLTLAFYPIRQAPEKAS